MKRTSRLHVLLAGLLTAIVICLLWFSERFSVALDITSNHRHSLSDTTVSLLKSIDIPVKLIAVLGPDPQQRESVAVLISRFQDIKPNMELIFINPETEPARARELNAAPGGELIVQAGTREQRLQQLSERNLANSFQQLMREGERNIAFITGHNERSPTRTTDNDWHLMSARLANIGLKSREVSLVSQPHLADDIDLVVIADPRQPYFPGEIASINNYLSRGGNLLWLSEPLNETPAESDTTALNLDLIADNLGIDWLAGAVIDTASQSLAGGSPDFVVLDRFPAHPVTQHLTNPVLLPQVKAIAVTPLAGQSALPLLQTPDSSWTETGPLSGAIQYNDNTAEVAGPLLLGITIERQLAQSTQRFAVIGDADFAASQFLGNGGNQSFTESLVLWLTGDSEALEFVTQRAPDSELNLSNQSIIVLTIVCLLLVPLLFLLIAGIVRWRRRKS